LHISDSPLVTHVMKPRPLKVENMLEELFNTLRATLMPAPALAPASHGHSCFLLSLFFEMQQQRFTTTQTKVAFFISLLSGKVLLWAKAIWNAQSVIINSYKAFSNHFKEVFGVAAGRDSWDLPTSIDD
uniref:DUF4939 domain-containing protein n=1 Tax=Cyprinus carpio TaxID=7962 RepID=A0A8C1GQE7_CYPCA